MSRKIVEAIADLSKFDINPRNLIKCPNLVTNIYICSHSFGCKQRKHKENESRTQPNCYKPVTEGENDRD